MTRLGSFLCLSAVAGLAGCGGSGGGSVTTDPPLADTVLDSAGIDFSRPGGGETFRFDSSDSPTVVHVQYDASSAPELTGNIGFSSGGTSTTTQTGTADFTGDYAGLIVDETNSEVVWSVSGDTSVEVSFASQQMSGSITNRVLRDAGSNQPDSSNTLSDLTLVSADITGNRVPDSAPGALSGGGLNGGSIVDGSYIAGIYLGTEDSVTGFVQLEHVRVGGNFPEWGIFTTTE